MSDVTIRKPRVHKLYFDIPQDLAMAAKVEAARQGLPLRQVVLQALVKLVEEGEAWRTFLAEQGEDERASHRGKFPTQKEGQNGQCI